MTAHVEWRGQMFDPRTRDMLVEVARISGDDILVHPTQGSYEHGSEPGSVGTHDGGGAVDLRVRDLNSSQRNRLLQCVRKVGFAGWLRRESQGFEADHLHAIAVQPGGKNDRGVLTVPAWDQVKDYYNNLNGLASNRPDDGPRQWVGVTWETYKNPQAKPCPGTITPEARGSVVRAWQNEMIAHHWLTDNSSNRDGYYGPGMQRRAREMQASLHVSVDAILGPVTWAALT